jgi:hypothetical protein
MQRPEDQARANDRGNLGDQTLKEFQQFVTPDDGRKFTELYNVQHLQSAQLDRVSRVCISTIQRLYSILRSVFFWLSKRSRKANSREETGSALCMWHELVAIGCARSTILSLYPN